MPKEKLEFVLEEIFRAGEDGIREKIKDLGEFESGGEEDENWYNRHKNDFTRELENFAPKKKSGIKAALEAYEKIRKEAEQLSPGARASYLLGYLKKNEGYQLRGNFLGLFGYLWEQYFEREKV